MKKHLKVKHKMTKKISNFQSFYPIFVKYSTDFVNWNVEKSQHGTNLLSSRLFQRVNCSFQVEKYLKLAPTQKTQNFPIFKVFMQFLSIFDRQRGLEC